MRFVFFVLLTVAVALPPVSVSAAEPDRGPGYRAPAGQVCPHGSYVIGFDAEANILCSGTCGDGVLNTGETCDDGNTVAGDGCSADCEAEAAEPKSGAAVVAVETTPAEQNSLASASAPAIENVKPWSVAWGTREVVIAVNGAGFNAGSVIVFQGTTYEPKVNDAGTRLDATIVTRGLGMGSYAITVSNGPGLASTLKKALVIY